MRIKVGIKSLEEARYFLENGADEIYFGLKMVPSHNASFADEGEIVKVIKLARRMKKKSLLALNEIYTADKYPAILDHARRMTDKGLDGIIVCDPALLEHFRKKKFRTYFVSSVVSACFNSQAMAFYRELGVRRVTLHNQVMPADAAKMMKSSSGMETAIFVPSVFRMENIVPFCFFMYPDSDGMYGMCHHACAFKYRCGRHDFAQPSSNLYDQAHFLYDYHRLGVDWLKVPRQLNGPKLVAEFTITKFLNGLLEKGLDRDTFTVALAELIERVDMNKYGKSFDLKPLPKG